MIAGNRFCVFHVVAALGLIASCAAAAATTAPSTQPSSQTRTFQNATANIRFKYPGDWISAKASTAIFNIVQPGNCAGCASFSVDVPGLPPAIFRGLITPKMVENGYVKDLRKNQIHDATVDESVELKLPASRARRVKCSGHEDGKVAIDVAVLIVHANRIYIFSCDSDEAGYPNARAALDAAVASTEWIK
jgi:hypothetical protein